MASAILSVAQAKEAGLSSLSDSALESCIDAMDQFMVNKLGAHIVSDSTTHCV